MYHKKKLAVFISHIYGDYQRRLINGVSQMALEYGYPLEIYATNDGEDLGDYSIGERSILKIPNFNDLEGVIFASATYTDYALKDEITDILKNSKVPVIEVTQSEAIFPYVKMENNITAGLLTEHCSRVHGCKRICYLGNINDRFYSDKREIAYKEAMAALDLPVSDQDVFLSDENAKAYTEALEFFKKGGKFDAVIAYNDMFALGFIEQAMLAGFTVPGDFLVTGCDELESGQNITPSLTTVSFPLDEVGKKAVEVLVNLISGKEIKNETVVAEPIYNESCGCKKGSPSGTFKYLRNRNRKIASLEMSMFESMKMSAALSHVTDTDEGADIIADFTKSWEEINEFYVCLNGDWDKIADPVLALARKGEEADFEKDESQMILKVGVKNGKRVPECTFSKSNVLPEFVSADDNKAFVITPLFFKEREFGYVAMSFKETAFSFKFEVVQWIMNISRFLRDCCEHERAGLLSRHLEELYLKDALTGLFNRHGFSAHFEKKEFTTKYMSLVLFDLDGLKAINDTFGHEEGDFALKTMGQAILTSKSADDICARFGGDEFYGLLFHDNKEYPDTFVGKVEKFLNNFNNLSEKTYSVGTSFGYSTIETKDFTEINVMLKDADEKLYAIKKKRHGEL